MRSAGRIERESTVGISNAKLLILIGPLGSFGTLEKAVFLFEINRLQYNHGHLDMVGGVGSIPVAPTK